jgi:O-antigen/teichoic acid export membrane protein
MAGPTWTDGAGDPPSVPATGTLLQRFGLPVADQLVSTLGNFIIGVVAARVLSKTAFGSFGIAFTVFILIVGVCRGTVGHMVLSPAFATQGSGRRLWRAALGAAAIVGVLGSVASALTGIVIGGATGGALIAIAVVLPALTVQDIWRHCFIAAQQPGAALGIDLVWLVAILPAVVLMRHVFPTSASILILAWGLAGVVSVVLGCLLGATTPRFVQGVRWVRANRHLAVPYLGEFLSVSGSQQIALLALAPIAGLAAVGATRGVFVLMGPLTVFVSGLFLALIPDANRLRNHPEQLGRRMLISSWITFAIAVLWVGVGYLIPTSVGAAILGQTWLSARPLILAAGLGIAASSAMVGPLSGLRALRASRYSFVARMWSLPLMLAFSLSFAALWGAQGFVIGSSIESIITFFLVAVAFRRANAVRGGARQHLHLAPNQLPDRESLVLPVEVVDEGPLTRERLPGWEGVARALSLTLAVLGGIIAVLVVATALAKYGVIVVIAAGVPVLLVAVLWHPRRITLAAWTATLLLIPMNKLRLATSVSLGDVFLVVAVASTLVEVIHKKHIGLRRAHLRLGGLLLILVGGAIATLLATDPVPSFTNVLRFGVAAFGSLIALVMWSPGERERPILLSAFLVGCTLSAGLGLLFLKDSSGRSQGLTLQPNHLALTCLLGLGIALGFTTGRRSSRWLAWVAVVILLAGVFESGSRAAALATPVVVLGCFLLDRRTGRVYWLAVIGSVALAGLATGSLAVGQSTSLGRLFQSQASVAGSNAVRVSTLSQNVTEYLGKPVTGVGFSHATAAHDVYLQLLVAGGPIALAGFLAFFWSLTRRSTTLMRNLPRSSYRTSIAGLTAGMLGYLVYSLFQNTLWERYLWLYLGLLAATRWTGRATSSVDVEDHEYAPQPIPASEVSEVFVQ